MVLFGIGLFVARRCRKARRARALANRPALLLADEPTGNLDSENGAHVVDLLRHLAKQHLVLAAAHNEALARIANQIRSRRDGTLVQAP